MLRMLHHGERLTRYEIYEISNKYRLSLHAQQRKAERMANVNLQKAIRNCILAYYNTDGTINSAFDEYTYLVVAPEGFKVVTIKEKSHNNINIWAKYDMARNGYDRKINW